MRKAAILMTVVLLLAICGVGVLAADTFGERDQVVLTENAIHGDPSAADGLTVQLRTTYLDQLFWDTTHTHGETPVMETEYGFSARPQYKGRAFADEGVVLERYSFTSDVMENSDEAISGLARAYSELFEKTPPGGETEAVIYLKDYIEYYPLAVTLDFPALNAFSLEYDYEGMDLNTEWGTEQYAIRKIQEYFKIPVLEEEQWQISVRRRESGELSGGGSGTTDSDFFHIWTKGVVTEDACYFTFETRTARKEQVVDTSHLPEGYGIFHVPYDENRRDPVLGKICPVDADGLDMVYPLDPEIRPLFIHTNPEQTKLLFHAVEDGKYVLTVIDIATMEPLQKLEIMDWPEDGATWNLQDEGDFLCVSMAGTLTVISVNEHGEYVPDFTCEAMREDMIHHPFGGLQRAMAYDGERLAVARMIRYEEDYWDKKSNYCLFVYDRSGLAYYGEYNASLDTGYSHDESLFYCVPRENEPLAVRWN